MIIVIFLFEIRTTMLKRSSLNCVDISRLSLNKRMDILKSLRLHPELFNPALRRPLDFGKSSITHADARGYEFLLLRYETSDPATALQYVLYNSLSVELQAKLFFTERSYCFTSKRARSVIHVYPRNLSNYWEALGRYSLTQLADSFLSVTEIFRAMENHHAIFTSSYALVPFISRNQDFKLMPVVLGKTQFLDRQYWANSPPYQPSQTHNSIGQSFVLQQADKRLHRSSLLDALGSYLGLRSLQPFHKNDGLVLKEFEQKLKVWTHLTTVENNRLFTWKELIAFLRSWGCQDVLAKIVADKKRDNNASRSCSSERNTTAEKIHPSVTVSSSTTARSFSRSSSKSAKINGKDSK